MSARRSERTSNRRNRCSQEIVRSHRPADPPEPRAVAVPAPGALRTDAARAVGGGGRRDRRRGRRPGPRGAGAAASGTPVASTIRWCLEPGRPRSSGLGPVAEPPSSPAPVWSRRSPAAVDPIGRPQAGSSARCRRSQTPAACHRSRRREQVAPEPKPSSRTFRLKPALVRRGPRESKPLGATETGRRGAAVSPGSRGAPHPASHDRTQARARGVRRSTRWRGDQATPSARAEP